MPEEGKELLGAEITCHNMHSNWMIKIKLWYSGTAGSVPSSR